MRRGPKRKTNKVFVAEVRALVGDEYTFLEEYKTNKDKIRVKHNKCGNEYSVTPHAFLNTGRRCGLCFGNNKKSNHEFKSEVSRLVGNEYEFLEDYKNSKTRITVRHNTCGNEYLVRPGCFIGGKRCPKCYGGKKKTDLEFKDEVRELVGEEYVFLEEYKTSHTKIMVKHNACGNEYLVKPTNFLSGTRCPICSESAGEKAVAKYLTRKGIKFDAEFPIKYSENKYPLRIDFFAEGVAIEYDGEQHFKPKKYWGGERALRETQRRDRIKNEYCAANGIPMIRIPYWDFDRIDEILTEKLLPLIRNKDDKLA